MRLLTDLVGAMAAQPGFAILICAALLGGIVRGFTGFGFAMVFVPIATLAVPPAVAIGLVWTVDAPFAFPLAARSLGRAEWREIAPLLIGSTALVPAGVFLLTHLDPNVARWTIALLILGAVAALASGWRYRHRPTPVYSVLIGAVSGITNGLANLGGLPIAMFWLAGQHTSHEAMRHNLMSFFAVSATVSGLVLALNGLLPTAVLLQAALLVPPYGVGILVGLWAYGVVSETAFRRISYGVIAASALLALPVADLFRR